MQFCSVDRLNHAANCKKEVSDADLITYAPYFGVKEAKRTVADAQNDPRTTMKKTTHPSLRLATP